MYSMYTVCIYIYIIYSNIYIYTYLYMQRIVSGKKHRPYINVEMHVNIKMSRFVWPGDSQIENQPYGCPFLPTGPCVSSKTGCELCLFWIYERKEHSSSKQPLFKKQLRNNKQEWMHSHIIEYSCFNAIRTFLFMNISPSMQPFSQERAKFAPPPGQPWVPTWCHTSRSLVPGPVSNNPFFAGMASRFFFGGWKWKGHGFL